MGDTDPPKFNVYRGPCHKDSRTARIEGQREFSAAPAPHSQFGPPDPKRKTPAEAVAAAGARVFLNEGQMQCEDYSQRLEVAREMRAYRVDRHLIVEVLR